MALSQAYKAWLGNPDNIKVMLAIVKYYFVPEFGSAEVAGERTLYLSSHKYIGNVLGTDIAFMNRILGSPRFKNELATSSEGSRTTASLGELQVNNADGQFDPWLNYGFDGRDIELYLGPPNGSFATEFGLIFKGKIDRLNINSNLSLSLLFKDKIAELDKPAITDNYELGVNISYTLTKQRLYNSGTGLYTESTISTPGTAAVTKDLDGKSKPLLFGFVRNIEPILLDSATRTYQISVGPISDIDKVYDNGIPIDYRVDLSTGIFSAINNTVGTVTCDVKGINTNAGAYSDKLPYTIKYLVCTLGGVPSINFITSPLVGTLPIGYYLKERRNILDILDDLIKSIDGYYGFDIDGNFFYGVLAIPSHDIPQKLTGNSASRYGDVVYDNTTNAYTDSTLIKRFVLASDIIGAASPKPTVDRTTGYYLVTEIPNNTIYKATASEVYGELNILGLSNVARNVGIKFARNYTVQTDLGSTVVATQREFAAQEWRQKVLDIPGVTTKFLTAPVIEPIESSIADIDTTDSGGPATGLDGADLLLARYLRKNSEIIYQVSFSMFFNTIAEARVGSIIKLEDARFGFASGRLAVLTSIELDYLNSQANITAIFYAKPFAGVSDSYKIGNSFYNISGTNTITYPSGTVYGGNDYILVTNPSASVNASALFDIGQFSYVRYVEVQPNLNATGKVMSVQASYTDATTLSIKNSATSPFVDITRTSNTVATIRYGKTGSLTTLVVPVVDWATVRFGIIYDFNNNKLIVVYKNSLDTSVLSTPVGGGSFFNADIPKSLIINTPTSSAVGITTISPTLVSFSSYFIPWTKITEPAAGLAVIFPANLVLLDETGATLLVETGNDALYVES